jgi:hypothetical protein
MYVGFEYIRKVYPPELLSRPKRAQFFFTLTLDYVLESDFLNGIVLEIEKSQKILYVSEYPK